MLAADFELLKNISPEPGTGSSNPSNFATVGDLTYFFAHDGVRRGLWRTDGTEEGTEFVLSTFDLPFSRIRDVVGAGETLYVFADFGVTDTTLQLWAFESTVSELQPLTTFAQRTFDSDPIIYAVAGDALFIDARSRTSGRELWKTDGTPAGTELVIEFRREGAASTALLGVGETLFFPAYDEVHAEELWKSDGTPEGTVLVKDINPEWTSARPSHFTEFGGLLYFEVFRIDGGTELWRSDGTESGTEMFAQIYPDRYQRSPVEPIAADHFLYYFTGGSHPNQLWRSDGTFEGTMLLDDTFDDLTYGHQPVAVGNRLFYVVNDDQIGSELWTSDGTPEGTRLVKDIYPGFPSADIQYLTAAGDYVYFQATHKPGGTELWRSDGTAEGTYIIYDVPTVAPTGHLTALTARPDGTILFSPFDSAIGYELWQYNPVSDQAELLKDINKGSGTQPRELSVIGGQLFFQGNRSSDVASWISDGTTEGTVLLELSDPVPAGTPGVLHQWQEYFVYEHADGNLSTFPLPMAGEWFLKRGNEYFFESDGRLWTTDGTVAGTELIATINTKDTGQRLFDPVMLGDVLYFTADGIGRTPTGRELWRSDGTAAGTYLVKDITQGEQSSQISSLTPFQGSLFFAKRTTSSPVRDELWISDGTIGGTLPIQSWFGADANKISVRAIVSGGPRLLIFTTGFPGVNYQVWTSDGTPEGTTLVGPAGIPPADVEYQDYLWVDETLYYVGLDSHGYELWRTDGTLAGTMQVHDINGDSSSLPAELTFHQGRIYFRASEGNEQEIWVTDGTSAGTRMYYDFHGNTGSGVVRQLTVQGSLLHVVATSTEYGREIHTGDLTPELPGDFNLDGTVDTADYNLWKASYGATSGHALVADGNFDGVVNMADYTLWRNNLGNSLSTEASLQAAATNEEPTAEPVAASAGESVRAQFVSPTRSSLRDSPSERPAVRQSFATSRADADRTLLLAGRDAAFSTMERKAPSTRPGFAPSRRGPRNEATDARELDDAIWNTIESDQL